MARCPWADGAPAGLVDAAEGWGMTRLANVFYRAHHANNTKRHEDAENPGRCYVCGGPLDLEAWLDEQDAEDANALGRSAS